MKGTADRDALRRGAALFLGTNLALAVVMLQLDIGYFASRGVDGAAWVVGIQHLLVISLAVWLATTASTARASALAALGGALFTSVSVLRMAALRDDPASMTVAIVALTLGASVLLPWGPFWQAILVVFTLAIAGLGIAWLGVPMSFLLMVFFVALLLASIYVAQVGEASRRELARLLGELGTALEVAEDRRRSLGAAIREQTRDLEGAAEELASFCHAASHDIRPPLRTMAGYSEILAEDLTAAEDTQARQAVEGIPPLAMEMGTQIDELLEGVRAMHRSMAGTLLSLGDVLEEECARARADGCAVRGVAAQGLYADTLGAVAGDLLRALVRYAASAPFGQEPRELRLAAEAGANGYTLRIEGGEPVAEEIALVSRCLRGDVGMDGLPERLDELGRAVRAWRAEQQEHPSFQIRGDAVEFRFGKTAEDGGAGAQA